MLIKINNLQETEDFAYKFASFLRPGDIVLLNGDLGAGKTTMTKYIGKGLGIDDYITSPSFSLINEYYGPVNLYHFDLYRLEGGEDILDLGLDDYLFGDGVSIIEWGDRIASLLPESTIELDISIISPSQREIKIRADEERYDEIVKGLEI